MDISYILLLLFAGVFVLLVGCTIYFFIYKHHINKVLVAPQKKHIKMIPPYKILIVCIILFVSIGLSFILTLLPGSNGVSTVNEIEKDVRSSQKISDDWNVEIATSNQIAAVIAYDDQKSDHAFSIYESDSGTKINYKFRYGGKSTSIERSVRVFRLDGATALISMNTLHIAAIECHDGERFEVDPNTPFVLIIPGGGFDVYDGNGNLIDITQDGWYELTELE